MRNQLARRLARKSRLGFTLIELLVVISIIALLLSIMLPSLRKAKDQVRRVVCAVNQRNIYSSIQMYLNDHRETLHEAPVHVRWYDLGLGTNNTGVKYNVAYNPNDPDTLSKPYWGIAYEPYGAEKEVFQCPAKKINNSHWCIQKPEDLKSYDYSDYAINGYLVRDMPRRASQTVSETMPGKDRRVTKFKNVSSVILLHDHWEGVLDGDDAYFIQEGKTVNLDQWRRLENDPLEGDAVEECWRHGGYYGQGKGASNILWLDGHSSVLKETTGEDVPVQWYTGGLSFGK